MNSSFFFYFTSIKLKFPESQANSASSIKKISYSNVEKIHVLFLFVCLFGVLRPTREFFTHLDTSPLTVEGFRFWPMLCTHSHWEVWICIWVVWYIMFIVKYLKSTQLKWRNEHSIPSKYSSRIHSELVLGRSCGWVKCMSGVVTTTKQRTF